MSRGEGLRRGFQRMLNPAEEEARDVREAERSARGPAILPIAEAADRSRALLEGELHSVTLRPRGGVPALEAELRDDSGAITLIWLGRRQIHGVAPGVRMRVEGRIGVHHGTRIIYNPRYDLRPAT